MHRRKFLPLTRDIRKLIHYNTELDTNTIIKKIAGLFLKA